VADPLDESWFLELEAATRHERLVLRHELHGKTRVEAEAWTGGSDEVSAALIAATRDRADLKITAGSTPDLGR
jgi:hypothetical protein